MRHQFNLKFSIPWQLRNFDTSPTLPKPQSISTPFPFSHIKSLTYRINLILEHLRIHLIHHRIMIHARQEDIDLDRILQICPRSLEYRLEVHEGLLLYLRDSTLAIIFFPLLFLFEIVVEMVSKDLGACSQRGPQPSLQQTSQSQGRYPETRNSTPSRCTQQLATSWDFALSRRRRGWQF